MSYRKDEIIRLTYQSEQERLMEKWAERDRVAHEFRGNLNGPTSLDQQMKNLGTADKLRLLEDAGRQNSIAYQVLTQQLDNERLAAAIAGKGTQVTKQVKEPETAEELEPFEDWYARTVEGKDLPSPEQKRAQADKELERQAERQYLLDHPEKLMEMKPSDRITLARELGLD